MALQIRVGIPDFSNDITFTDPVILENADQISLTKTLNSSDESISFSIPVNDAKLQYVNYLRWWECWDTSTNQRRNYGPITQISEATGETKQVSGPGRSQLLADIYKSERTFYTTIEKFLDSLRYENLAGEPRTQTLIDPSSSSEYYGLSLRSKDNAIDEETGYISPGRETPARGTLKTESFWSGTDVADYLTVDLGDSYTISKINFLTPWWGGSTIQNNRTYDYNISYSNDNTNFTQIYTTGTGNKDTTYPQEAGRTFYLGETGYEVDQVTVSGVPVAARYWKFNISDTHAWYGNFYQPSSLTDEWSWECNNSNIFKGGSKPSPTGTIDKVDITPMNDCHASIVEIGLKKKIIGKDSISNRIYQQIENSSPMITYSHNPAASEMITTDVSTIRKFEPGSFLRTASITWTGGAIDVYDEYRTKIYSNGGSSGTVTIDVPDNAFSELQADPAVRGVRSRSPRIHAPRAVRVLQIEGSSTSQVTYCDTWPAKLDPLSFAGSYAYTTITNDYAIAQFRGTSIKWMSTVPAGETAGQVKIELRSKTTGDWSAWSTLETSLTLPTDIAGEKVWEITEESGTLTDGPVYQIKITNLNGGYVSIDCFAGYWSSTWTEYNEDSDRIGFRFPAKLVQVYSSKFGGGSAYEFDSSQYTDKSILMGLPFTGDRVIVYARKGNGFGNFVIGMTRSGDGYGIGYGSSVFSIPGGDSDGRITIDCNYATEIPQAIVFDTNDYWPNGLPWGNYTIHIYDGTSSGKFYIDGFAVHEKATISTKYIQTNHLDILKETCEALRLEWDVTESGLKVVPRIGSDTYVILKEGTNTTIKINNIQDVTKLATHLITSGADIDGLPLTAVVEDKKSRSLFGRTVQRLADFRNIGDYFTLIGAARTELRMRRNPQRRVSISHAGVLPISLGDSFIVKTKDEEFRVRAMTITEQQSSSAGYSCEVEAIAWPLIP